ncbi:phage/plasmid primase, P4 family [Clostridium sp. UBA4548]|uniref:phage/plasmid primase, P4 family n=1 Tax=Clostridium sp. UBA4548 TaxID=1946361 RepID=UPI0025BA0531|nr:phage/plasmid primase, P4 family [Clostridium sp. UBA4548]
MFKGYIPTKGKKPLEEYKERKEFYSYEWARKTFNEFAGILEDNLVQIDLDDSEQAETLYKIIKSLGIKCHMIKTDRGRHFYFINPGITNRKQGVFNALGFKCDIGLGSQNAVIPIKIDGRTRTIKQVEQPDKLPVWLYPIDKSCFANFSNLEEGDGRNNTLFTYILKLQSYGFVIEEIREIIKVINQFILKEPISDNELDVILRDDAFRKGSFVVKNKFNMDKFIEVFLREHHIVNINNNIYLYKDGIYTSDKLEIKRCIDRLYSQITIAQINEAIGKLEIRADSAEVSEPSKIPVLNGLYNLENDMLEPFTHSYIATNKIPVNYNPAAYDKDLDQALNDICCNDRELRAVIEEMFGATLYRTNKFNRLFILGGDGSNGKSTILDLMKSMLGKDNVSSIPLQDFAKTFKTYQIMDKLANIGDDISKDETKYTGVLKKLVTGETVNVERKGKDPFDINNYANLFFSSNHAVIINDTSYGIKRRVMNIPFNAKFVTGKNEKHDILNRARSGDKFFMEYMLKLSIEGLQRLIKQGNYTKSLAVNKSNREFEENNNPVLAFLNELESYDVILFNKDEDAPSTEEVYLRFTSWIINQNMKYGGTQKNFLSEVKGITGFKITSDRRKAEFIRKFGGKDKVSVFKK